MLTEKQRIRNSINLKKWIIKAQHKLIEISLRIGNHNLEISSSNIIISQEEAIIALETKLGILAEKRRL